VLAEHGRRALEPNAEVAERPERSRLFEHPPLGVAIPSDETGLPVRMVVQEGRALLAPNRLCRYARACQCGKRFLEHPWVQGAGGPVRLVDSRDRAEGRASGIVARRDRDPTTVDLDDLVAGSRAHLVVVEGREPREPTVGVGMVSAGVSVGAVWSIPPFVGPGRVGATGCSLRAYLRAQVAPGR
jgi:hypothetical protein